MGGLFLTILSAIAEFERETIKERMTLGKLGRAKAGKAMSFVHPPFGYKNNTSTGILETDPLESSVVQKRFRYYMNGLSITRLREKLNEEGHIGKEKIWTHSSIRRTLKNPVYYGKIRFSGKEFDGLHEPIITEEVFMEVQVELKKKTKANCKI